MTNGTGKLEIDTLKSLLNSTQRNYSLADLINKSALSRLVWFVAISGFGLTFSWQFLDRLQIEHIPIVAIILISAPWLISAILSIAAHYSIDEMVRFDQLHIAAKISLIELLTIDLQRDKEVTDQAVQIINDTHPAYREYVANAKQWNKVTTLIERSSLITLLISFILVPIVLFIVSGTDNSTLFELRGHLVRYLTALGWF